MNPPYSVMSSLLAVMIGTLLMLSILSMMMIGVCIVYCVHCVGCALCKEEQTGERRWLEWWLQLEVSHPFPSWRPTTDKHSCLMTIIIRSRILSLLLSMYDDYDYDNEYN